MSFRRLGLFVLSLTGALACPSGRSDLFVDVRSDLVPGVDFVTVTTARFDSLPSPSVEDRRERRVTIDDDFIAGRRVAELEVSHGDHVLRVRLFALDGSMVLERTAIVTVRANTVVTLVMTRDCRGVMCPGANDRPELTECLGGRCVAPECTEEHPEACPPSACTDSATCPGGVACASPICIAGACLLARNDSLCAANEFCDPSVGCRPRTEIPDAGPLGEDGGASGDGGAADGGGAVDVGTGGGGGFDGGLGPALGWPLTFGGVLLDQVEAVAVLSDGTVLSGGSFQGGVEIAGRLLDAPLVESSWMARLDPTSAAYFVRYSGEGKITATAGSTADRAYVGGVFRSALQMGAASRAGDANGDGFVAAVDAAGVGIWSRLYAGSSSDLGPCQLFLSSSGIEVMSLIGSSCGGSGGIGAGLAPIIETVAPDGSALQSTTYDLCSLPPVDCNDPRDDVGNYYVIERLVDRLMRAGTNYRTNGLDDLLIVQYDLAFAEAWALQIGGAGVDGAHTAAVFGGDLWVLGLYDGSVDFGGTVLTSSAPDGLFLARIGPRGTVTNAFDLGTLTRAGARTRLAQDEAGNLYFASGMTGPATVLGTVVDAASAGAVVVGSVDSAGATRWVTSYGDGVDGNASVRALAAGGGFVYVAGGFSGTAVLPGATRTSAGSMDGYIARLDARTGLP